MTREDKELLFKDLCARLPYTVFMTNKKLRKTFYPLTCEDLKDAMFDDAWDDIPYLRPMSSMTEEEKKEYQALQDTACSYHYEFSDIVDDFLYFDNDVSLDYLNSIHVDYRGLIPKGLALEAPEGMYNN